MIFPVQNFRGMRALFLLCAVASLVVPTGCSTGGYSGWANAANDRDIALANKYIYEQESLESTDLYKDTPLLWAARNGQTSVVEFLLSNRLAAVNQKNKITGETALILAIKDSHTPIVAVLKRFGADSSVKDNTGRSARDWAAQRGNNDVLLTLAAGGTEAHSPGDKADTLVSAVYSRNLETVRLLSQEVSDINIKNGYGETALIAAAKVGATAISDFLLKRQASPHAVDRQGRTPLVLAVQAGHVDVVAQLINQGISVRTLFFNEYPVLFYAAANGQGGMVQLLLNSGAIANAVSTDGQKQTALLIAAQSGHADVVVVLLDHNADVNHQNANGDTALMIAAAKGFAGIVDALLLHAANPNLESREMHTALNLSARNRHWFVSEQLLAAGADTDREMLSYIDSDPGTAGPMFELAGRYFRVAGSQKKSAVSFKHSATAYRNLAKTYRSDARTEKLFEYIVVFTETLIDSGKLYAQQEKARQSAKSLNQIRALGAADSHTDYFQLSKQYQSEYERLSAIEAESQQRQYDWIAATGADSKTLSSTNLQKLADKAEWQANRIDELQNCLAQAVNISIEQCEQ